MAYGVFRRPPHVYYRRPSRRRLVPTKPGLLAITGRLRQPYAVQLVSVTGRIRQPFIVRAAITGRQRQPYIVRGNITGRIRQPYAVGSVTVRGRLRQPSKVFRTLVQVGAGIVEGSTRMVVRTTAGRVYIFAFDDAPYVNSGFGSGHVVLRAYKSDTAGTAIVSFTEQDGTHRPQDGTAGGYLNGVDTRYDPKTGLVHMVYTDGSSGDTANIVYYQTFDTTTDLWGSRETVATGAFGTGSAFHTQNRARTTACIVLGNDDSVHVVYCSSNSAVAHKTRTGVSTWSSATTISSGETSPLHPMLACDSAGDFHVAWFSQETDRKMRYCKRTSGSWGTVETVAQNSVDTGGVCDHGNLDQSGSIVLLTGGRPAVQYLSNPGGGGVDDNTGDLFKLKVRSANGGAGTWSHDDPTRTSLSGVHTHAPQIYAQGDDLYAVMAHGDAPNLWPGYSKKLSGGSWTGGPTGQVTIPAGSSSIGDTALFDGLAYISGVRTSKGTVGSTTGTLDGSSSMRWDPQRETNGCVMDTMVFDENVGDATAMLYYSQVPTERVPITGRVRQPYGVTATSPVTGRLRQPFVVVGRITAKIRQPYLVRATVNGKIRQPFTVRTVITGRARQPYIVRAAVTGRIRQPFIVRASVTVRARQPFIVRAPVTGKIRRPYAVRAAISGRIRQPYAVASSTVPITGRIRQPYAARASVSARLRQPFVIALTHVTGRSRHPFTVRGVVSGRSRHPYTVRRVITGRLRQRYAIGEVTQPFTYTLDDAEPFTYTLDD